MSRYRYSAKILTINRFNSEQIKPFRLTIVEKFIEIGNDGRRINRREVIMSEQLTEAQRSEWVREQFQKANKYLAEKGILTEQVAPAESRYLAPILAIWRLKVKGDADVWVISGDLPTDHIPLSTAESARDTLRHFAMKWQLQAENILNSGTQDKTQQEFGQLLIGRAEGLYQLYDKEELWVN
jgi:hypothetical protein